MTFPEKSSIATIVALVAVFGAYFALALSLGGGGGGGGVVHKPLLVGAVIALAVVMAGSHGLLAALAPADADAFDERDRRIAWRGGHVGGLVLAVGVCAALVLTLLEVPYVHIANALLLAWVLAELADQATRLVLYRRGG